MAKPVVEPDKDICLDDPGLIIISRPPGDVDACMRLPSVANLAPPLQPGERICGLYCFY